MHHIFRGKSNIRIPPELHAEIVAVAISSGKSLNQCTMDSLDQTIHNG
ncbi:MAG: toxin-antitoxin system HicB family antitoxin [Thermodesulfobacteriota bacterium]|nr:toxin-antitoxin system HicB family antitoxin [Thermodesulfobacteriota bacterium]